MPYCALSGLAHHKRRARHGFDAAGNCEIHVADANGARRIADGVQSRRAKPIDSEAGNGVRQPGKQQGHARDIAIVFAGLVRATKEHFVETRPVGLRVAIDERADRRGAKVVGAHFRQRAAIAADRGARGVADENIPHCSLLVRPARSQFVGARAGSVKPPPPLNDSTPDLTAFGSNVRRMGDGYSIVNDRSASAPF